MKRYLLGTVSLLLLSCENPAPLSSGQQNNYPLDTFSLVKAQCSRCHQWPSPTTLDSVTWQQHVLPRMGYFLGIYDQDNPRDALLENDVPVLLEQNIFPESALLKNFEWQAIQDYYLDHAPERLPEVSVDFQKTQSLFKAFFPSSFLSPPGSILTRFSSNGTYYIGDVNKEQILMVNQQHNIIGNLSCDGGAVDLTIMCDRIYLTSIGSFSPTDSALGKLISYSLKQQNLPSEVVIDSLRRPVHTVFHDLNGDGRQDIIIAEFGKWTGTLRWWESQANGTYHAHPLLEKAGALRIAINDINADSHPDIIALFGQGDESFWAFYNDGKGDFTARQLMQLPPSFGSSFFQLIDWNNDGRQDILYTNGDNADYPPIVKPYHGIRIFEQDADHTFHETIFLPLPGAYQARAADFDLDGDLDLFAISFFPDFENQPEQGLVLFQNEGNAKFSAQSFAQVNSGRWITMDMKDFDNDGDQDLLLGALAFEITPPNKILNQWITNGLGWMYLENLTK